MNSVNRESYIRSKLSEAETIYRIRDVYHSNVKLNHPNFDIWDQLLACEAVAESTPVNYEYLKNNESMLNGNGNDIRKLTGNFSLTERKLEIISQLKETNYLTPPETIAELLQEFFIESNSKEGHWLYIAQSYTPKSINSVLNRLKSVYKTSKNPAAYFTFLIKKKSKRRIL